MKKLNEDVKKGACNWLIFKHLRYVKPLFRVGSLFEKQWCEDEGAIKTSISDVFFVKRDSRGCGGGLLRGPERVNLLGEGQEGGTVSIGLGKCSLLR